LDAKSIQPGIYVGLILEQVLQNNLMQVNGFSYVRDNVADNVSWNSGLKEGRSVQGVVDLEHFKFLAENLVDSDSEDGRVFVFNDNGGGCWNNEDFGEPGNGDTLVIFNTWQPISFCKSSISSPFYPTIIAPFSQVRLDANMGTIKGTIVASELVVTGDVPQDYREFVFDAVAYNGTMECRDTPAPSAPPSMSPAPSDVPSQAPTNSSMPSVMPSDAPSLIPSDAPSLTPSSVPSVAPSAAPTLSAYPSVAPSDSPTLSSAPSALPTGSAMPSVVPTNMPSTVPSEKPSATPTLSPKPSTAPTRSPTKPPSTASPTVSPTNVNAQQRRLSLRGNDRIIV
jgi:hypothetical protein